MNARNLGYATLDLRRALGAYGQHLAWSKVLGAFLVRPFGSGRASTSRARLTEDGLPLAMRLGVAHPEPAMVANSIAVVRRDTYRAGWLGQLWEQHINDAADRLGPDGVDLREDPNALYAERAGEGSLLNRWVELICREGPTVGSADEVWQQMNVAASPKADQLLDRVVSAEGLTPMSRTEFMSSVDGDLDLFGSRHFDGVLFTPAARTEEKNAVNREPWQRSTRTGLSSVAVLVELSDGLRTYELVQLGPPDEFRRVPVDQPIF